MADKFNVLLFAFVGDREEGVARRQRDHFNEVSSAMFQVANSSARLLCIGDRILLRSLLPTACQPRSGSNDMWANQRSGFNRLLPGKQRLQIAAHIPHPDNSIGE